MRRLATGVTILLAIVMILAVKDARANLITNGSFEMPVVPVGNFTNFLTGSALITGWTVTGPEVSVVSGTFTQSGFTFPAQNGNQWLDLTGGEGTNSFEGVVQTVSTTPGTNYDLSYWVGECVRWDFWHHKYRRDTTKRCFCWVFNEQHSGHHVDLATVHSAVHGDRVHDDDRV